MHAKRSLSQDNPSNLSKRKTQKRSLVRLSDDEAESPSDTLFTPSQTQSQLSQGGAQSTIVLAHQMKGTMTPSPQISHALKASNRRISSVFSKNLTQVQRPSDNASNPVFSRLLASTYGDDPFARVLSPYVPTVDEEATPSPGSDDVDHDEDDGSGDDGLEPEDTTSGNAKRAKKKAEHPSTPVRGALGRKRTRIASKASSGSPIDPDTTPPKTSRSGVSKSLAATLTHVPPMINGVLSPDTMIKLAKSLTKSKKPSSHETKGKSPLMVPELSQHKSSPDPSRSIKLEPTSIHGIPDYPALSPLFLGILYQQSIHHLVHHLFSQFRHNPVLAYQELLQFLLQICGVYIETTAVTSIGPIPVAHANHGNSSNTPKKPSKAKPNANTAGAEAASPSINLPYTLDAPSKSALVQLLHSSQTLLHHVIPPDPKATTTALADLSTTIVRTSAVIPSSLRANQDPMINLDQLVDAQYPTSQSGGGAASQFPHPVLCNTLDDIDPSGCLCRQPCTCSLVQQHTIKALITATVELLTTILSSYDMLYSANAKTAPSSRVSTPKSRRKSSRSRSQSQSQSQAESDDMTDDGHHHSHTDPKLHQDIASFITTISCLSVDILMTFTTSSSLRCVRLIALPILMLYLHQCHHIDSSHFDHIFQQTWTPPYLHGDRKAQATFIDNLQYDSLLEVINGTILGNFNLIFRDIAPCVRIQAVGLFGGFLSSHTGACEAAYLRYLLWWLFDQHPAVRRLAIASILMILSVHCPSFITQFDYTRLFLDHQPLDGPVSSLNHSTDEQVRRPLPGVTTIDDSDYVFSSTQSTGEPAVPGQGLCMNHYGCPPTPLHLLICHPTHWALCICGRVASHDVHPPPALPRTLQVYLLRFQGILNDVSLQPRAPAVALLYLLTIMKFPNIQQDEVILQVLSTDPFTQSMAGHYIGYILDVLIYDDQFRRDYKLDVDITDDTDHDGRSTSTHQKKTQLNTGTTQSQHSTFPVSHTITDYTEQLPSGIFSNFPAKGPTRCSTMLLTLASICFDCATLLDSPSEVIVQKLIDKILSSIPMYILSQLSITDYLDAIEHEQRRIDQATSHQHHQQGKTSSSSRKTGKAQPTADETLHDTSSSQPSHPDLLAILLMILSYALRYQFSKQVAVPFLYRHHRAIANSLTQSSEGAERIIPTGAMFEEYFLHTLKPSLLTMSGSVATREDVTSSLGAYVTRENGSDSFLSDATAISNSTTQHNSFGYIDRLALPNVVFLQMVLVHSLFEFCHTDLIFYRSCGAQPASHRHTAKQSRKSGPRDRGDEPAGRRLGAALPPTLFPSASLTYEQEPASVFHHFYHRIQILYQRYLHYSGTSVPLLLIMAITGFLPQSRVMLPTITMLNPQIHLITATTVKYALQKIKSSQQYHSLATTAASLSTTSHHRSTPKSTPTGRHLEPATYHTYTTGLTYITHHIDHMCSHIDSLMTKWMLTDVNAPSNTANNTEVSHIIHAFTILSSYTSCGVSLTLPQCHLLLELLHKLIDKLESYRNLSQLSHTTRRSSSKSQGSTQLSSSRQEIPPSVPIMYLFLTHIISITSHCLMIWIHSVFGRYTADINADILVVLQNMTQQKQRKLGGGFGGLDRLYDESLSPQDMSYASSENASSFHALFAQLFGASSMKNHVGGGAREHDSTGHNDIILEYPTVLQLQSIWSSLFTHYSQCINVFCDITAPLQQHTTVDQQRQTSRRGLPLQSQTPASMAVSLQNKANTSQYVLQATSCILQLIITTTPAMDYHKFFLQQQEQQFHQLQNETLRSHNQSDHHHSEGSAKPYEIPFSPEGRRGEQSSESHLTSLSAIQDLPPIASVLPVPKGIILQAVFLTGELLCCPSNRFLFRDLTMSHLVHSPTTMPIVSPYVVPLDANANPASLQNPEIAEQQLSYLQTVHATIAGSLISQLLQLTLTQSNDIAQIASTLVMMLSVILELRGDCSEAYKQLPIAMLVSAPDRVVHQHPWLTQTHRFAVGQAVGYKGFYTLPLAHYIYQLCSYTLRLRSLFNLPTYLVVMNSMRLAICTLTLYYQNSDVSLRQAIEIYSSVMILLEQHQQQRINEDPSASTPVMLSISPSSSDLMSFSLDGSLSYALKQSQSMSMTPSGATRMADQSSGEDASGSSDLPQLLSPRKRPHQHGLQSTTSEHEESHDHIIDTVSSYVPTSHAVLQRPELSSLLQRFTQCYYNTIPQQTLPDFQRSICLLAFSGLILQSNSTFHEVMECFNTAQVDVESGSSPAGVSSPHSILMPMLRCLCVNPNQNIAPMFAALCSSTRINTISPAHFQRYYYSLSNTKQKTLLQQLKELYNTNLQSTQPLVPIPTRPPPKASTLELNSTPPDLTDPFFEVERLRASLQLKGIVIDSSVCYPLLSAEAVQSFTTPITKRTKSRLSASSSASNEGDEQSSPISDDTDPTQNKNTRATTRKGKPATTTTKQSTKSTKRSISKATAISLSGALSPSSLMVDATSSDDDQFDEYDKIIHSNQVSSEQKGSKHTKKARTVSKSKNKENIRLD